ncbi:hypothetical protein Cni_G05596 [Canna indica]|uniref:Neprosin PEP catalytic domain-containing protein n=1 Tax=Canna indica TaxID=4628 RepID=A0AAQ3JV68_9LILI|nr:hypothetical protein Cni_G05596 [Canna indica]
MDLMEKELFPVVLCLTFLLLVCGKRNTFSMEKELLVEDKLKLLNRPSVKTIQSEDGDIIDCVDIYKQPAFDHPLLRNHIIEMRPGDENETSQATASMPFQVWQNSGSCPEGTIPILRVQRHHLLNAPSLEGYGRKSWHGITNQKVYSFTVGVPNQHAHCVLVGGDFQYNGLKANLNIWNPLVEYDDEFTTSQIWLKNGNDSSFDSIEAGWTVNPSLYGDRRTRFFVYWTADSGRTTGCFNLLCSGFVQTTPLLALGSSFINTSMYYSAQFQMSLTIEKDAYDQNWWLTYGDNLKVGYWPHSLFNMLEEVASQAWFGGDVYSPRLRIKPHTETDMGSGMFSSFHWSVASWISNPSLKDYNTNEYLYPNPNAVFCSQKDCYSGEHYANNYNEEPLFYFGGPGRNLFCE